MKSATRSATGTLLMRLSAAMMMSAVMPMEAAAKSAFLSSRYSWMRSGRETGSQMAMRKSRACA